MVRRDGLKGVMCRRMYSVSAILLVSDRDCHVVVKFWLWWGAQKSKVELCRSVAAAANFSAGGSSVVERTTHITGFLLYIIS